MTTSSTRPSTALEIVMALDVAIMLGVKTE
jgi:hypothetical protein